MTVIFLMFAATIQTAYAVPFDSDNQVTFVSHVGNTWAYDVIISEGTCYWVIAWCGGNSSVTAYSDDEADYSTSMSYGVYGNIQGLKFEYPTGSQGETIRYWFTLDDDYAEGTVDAVVVGLTNTKHYGTVTGPIFTVSLVTEITGIGPINTKIVATAETDNPSTSSATFYWYGPFQPGTSWADPTRLWNGLTDWYGHSVPNTKTEDWTRPVTGSSTFVSGPYEVTENHLGDWYAIVVFEGGSCHADDTLPVNFVSWSTILFLVALPLLLLVTIGTVVFLKRKGFINLPST